jgi:hypothetical protein
VRTNKTAANPWWDGAVLLPPLDARLRANLKAPDGLQVRVIEFEQAIKAYQVEGLF